MKKLKLSRLVLLLSTLLMLPTAARAGSFSVSPVRVDLSARHPHIVLQIANHNSEPATIQVHVVSWSFAGEKDLYTRSDQVLLNPPIFTVGPNQKQSMRLGLRAPSLNPAETAYRVILEEVPNRPPPGFSGLRTLLRISIPVFVPPLGPVTSKLVWQARRTAEGGLEITAANQGNTHVLIRALQLSPGETAPPSFLLSQPEYLLPGQARTWSAHVRDVRDNSRIWVAAKTDAGEINEVLVASVR